MDASIETERDTFDIESFATVDPNLAFSPNIYFNGLDLEFHNDIDSSFTASEAPSSTNTTTVSTPDFSSFTFNHSPGVIEDSPRGIAFWPTPASNPPTAYPLELQTPPHPYPVELQTQKHQEAQRCHSNQIQAVNSKNYGNPNEHFYQKSLPFRPMTRNMDPRLVRPPLPRGRDYARTNQPFHRRSLSQSDADRLAAAQSSQPYFFRPLGLRTTTPNNVSSGDEYEISGRRENVRNTYNSNVGKRTKNNHPTSAPIGTLSRYGTTIGTPMNPSSVRLKHMSFHDKRTSSPRVIEIGAMSVMTRDMEERGRDRYEHILFMVERVQKKLEQEFGPECPGLTSCKNIRELVLAEKARSEETNITEDVNCGGNGDENIFRNSSSSVMSSDLFTKAAADTLFSRGDGLFSDDVEEDLIGILNDTTSPILIAD
ncbi:hypothetical protein B0J11DRAFT_566117 [Dendryphion nanum]|uniref:Uncharacterized protein n=1 Tax=Dendryphion nanum TaxID=256645 RepID=A0A9P9E666_9PLEO|nr:hypothetical protein B0J11DRAFT_566117 [Dendryphion nanum]